MQPENKDFRTVVVPEDLLSRMIRLQEKEYRFRQIRFYLLVFVIALPSLIYAISVMKLIGKKEGPEGGYASLVRIEGPIDPNSDASSQNILPSLEAAFKDEGSRGVVLLINSPGGTPVQSGVIHDRILSMKEKYKKEVIAIGRDQMTSGAYMIAVAADYIYANEATIVGSIGVAIRSFGAHDVLRRLGIERRVYTAGQSKNQMDPFLPERKEDVVKTRQMLDAIHKQFIEKVKRGRAGKLTGPESVIFSGDYWVADQALSMGLIDGVGDLPAILVKHFGVEAVKDYTMRSLFGDLSRKFIGHFSASARLVPDTIFSY